MHAAKDIARRRARGGLRLLAAVVEDVADDVGRILAGVELAAILQEARIGVDQTNLRLHPVGPALLAVWTGAHIDQSDRLAVRVEHGLDVCRKLVGRQTGAIKHGRSVHG